MKALLALGLFAAAAPLTAKTSVPNLPGISDKETTIPYGDIRQSERGHGDVIFVRDRVNQWYRMQLNPGCLRPSTRLDAMVFRHNGSQIDRFTTISIPNSLTSCSISSIRRSEAPPQVNSKSRVTLD